MYELLWGMIGKLDKALLIFKNDSKWVEGLNGIGNSLIKFRMVRKTFYKCELERLHVSLPVNMIQEFLRVCSKVTLLDQFEHNLSHIRINHLQNIVAESKNINKLCFNPFCYKQPWHGLVIVLKWLLLKILSWMFFDQVNSKMTE